MIFTFIDLIVFDFSMDGFSIVGLRFRIKLLAGKSIALCFSPENKQRERNQIISLSRQNKRRKAVLFVDKVLTLPGRTCRIQIYSGFY